MALVVIPRLRILGGVPTKTPPKITATPSQNSGRFCHPSLILAWPENLKISLARKMINVGPLNLGRVALGIAGSALMIVGTYLKSGGLA